LWIVCKWSFTTKEKHIKIEVVSCILSVGIIGSRHDRVPYGVCY
jgi:hypothetical protein